MKAKETTQCIATAQLQSLLQQKAELLIIDVRSEAEFLQQHIPAALNIPIADLNMWIPDLPLHKQIVTVCAKGGGRSAEAAGLLQEAGFTKPVSLCGGTAAWFQSR